MKTNSGPTPVKPRNWLLAKSRQWHTWGGLIAALFLVVVGVSGLILNYKQPIFGALGIDRKRDPAPKAPAPSGPTREIVLTTATDPSGLPVSLGEALAIARERWGQVRIERIEWKSEHGETHYRIRRAGGEEIWVNAASGVALTKGAYGRTARGPGARETQTDWGKILIDLHTGKIGGAFGKAIMSSASVLLVLLSLSGVYMWVKPLLIRRENRKVKAVCAHQKPSHFPGFKELRNQPASSAKEERFVA